MSELIEITDPELLHAEIISEGVKEKRNLASKIKDFISYIRSLCQTTRKVN